MDDPENPKRDEHCCAICGAKNVPLHYEHIIPVSRGGRHGLQNLRLVCREHLLRTQSPNETEFISYLVQLLEKSGKYKEVKREEVLTGKDVLTGKGVRIIVDIKAISREGNKVTLLECKSFSALTEENLIKTIDRLKYLSDQIRQEANTEIVLVLPSRLSDNSKKIGISRGISIWDVDYLANNFHDSIKSVPHPYYQNLLLGLVRLTATEEEKFIKELKNCLPGNENWWSYQNLIGKIFEHLFRPPLEAPIPESSDGSGSNRRDYILPNYASNEFWLFIREKYQADYIVIDAKNYSSKISKTHILQLANYLKPYGCGLFGIICCRNGGDSRGCAVTVREQWIAHRKLILILDDKDIENMLLAKSSGGKPEEILSGKIQEFRLSL
jgi:hypothetical protein